MNRVQAGLRNCSIPGTGKGCFTSLKSSNMPTQRVPAAYSTGVKQPGHKAVHSSSSTCKLRNVQSWTFPPLPYPFISVVLNQEQTLPLTNEAGEKRLYSWIMEINVAK